MEWLTPPHIIKALGEFDLDPCAPVKRPWDMAKKHFTKADDGLVQPWQGRVWCNPPYGQKHTHRWLYKLAEHGNGIALIFARTGTRGFFESIWERADAVMFIKGKVRFHLVDGSLPKAGPGTHSCLVAYGEENVKALHESGLEGFVIRIPRTPGDQGVLL